MPLIYDELRKLAAAKMAEENPGQTLQATALVHDAYIRLVDRHQAQHWDSRGHFFAAAEAMRRIVIERARAKATQKRGGGKRLNLDDILLPDEERSDELLRLEEALLRLEKHDAPAAMLVKMRFFGGLSHQEAAAAMGISRQAADRLWKLARAWLYRQIAE